MEMLTEEEYFPLPSRNATHCACSYEDINGQPRMLVINETAMFALRACRGVTGDRYGLEHLPADSIPEDAKLVSCHIVPTCRGGDGKLGRYNPKPSPRQNVPGMVCLAIRTSPLATRNSVDRGTRQGDTAGGPATVEATLHGGGLLNIYAMGGERSFEVERALQRQPQQFFLSYTPVGMVNATVWRNVAPNDLIKEDSTVPCQSVERGDTVLLWDQDGIVHGYTRWEDCSPGSREGGISGRVSGDLGSAVALTEESRESLDVLVPELRSIGGPVLSLSTKTVDEGGGVRLRQLLAGCNDGVYHVSFDLSNGRKETAFAPLNGEVPAVAFKTRPPSFSLDGRSGNGVRSNSSEEIGFACGRLGVVAWVVEDRRGAQEGERFRWLTGEVPRCMEGDMLKCMDCAAFCHDTSAPIAVGTLYGSVIVLDIVSPNPCEDFPETGAENCDRLFCCAWVDDGADTVSEVHPGQGAGLSPRPKGAKRQNRAIGESPSTRVLTDLKPSLVTKWQRDMPHPVFGIVWGDFNHDGVSEMVVVTQKSVHVFRPNYRGESSRLAKTLQALKRLQPDETGYISSSTHDESTTSSSVNVFRVEVGNDDVGDILDEGLQSLNKK